MMGVSIGHPRGPAIAVEELGPAGRFARMRALARAMLAADEAFYQSSHAGTRIDWIREWSDAANGLSALLDLMEVRGTMDEIEAFLTVTYGG
jgi:hypothetical protein